MNVHVLTLVRHRGQPEPDVRPPGPGRVRDARPLPDERRGFEPAHRLARRRPAGREPGLLLQRGAGPAREVPPLQPARRRDARRVQAPVRRQAEADADRSRATASRPRPKSPEPSRMAAARPISTFPSPTPLADAPTGDLRQARRTATARRPRSHEEYPDEDEWLAGLKRQIDEQRRQQAAEAARSGDGPSVSGVGSCPPESSPAGHGGPAHRRTRGLQ